MKNLLVTLAVFTSTLLFSQEDKEYAFISIGADPVVAAFGSELTDSSQLNAQIRIAARFKAVEVGLQYQHYPANIYKQYSGFVNYILPTDMALFYKEAEISIGVETGSIMRSGNSNSLFYGGNIEFRLHLTDKMILGLQLNGKVRPDRTYFYDTGKTEFKANTMINLSYKLN